MNNTKLEFSPSTLLLLFLAAVLVISAGMGLRDPWPADEPRFALVAKEMVESGDWFFPRRGGELYPDKPPLFMWAQAGFYQLTGSMRVAFLMPSLLAGLGVLWLITDLGRRLWSPRVGLVAGWTLLACLQFTLQARTAQIDAALAFWVVLSLYGFCRHLLLGPSWPWYWLAFAAAGFGIITKGVGIIACLILVPWAWASWRRWQQLTPAGKQPAKWLIGPVAMLAAISCWLIPMIILVGMGDDPALQAYRDNILLKQTAERYANSWHHIKPFWYFAVEVVPAFWMPLSLALPWLVPHWYRALKQKDARILMLLGYALLALLFFSLSPGKRGVYILPLLPAVVLAASPYIEGLLANLKVQRLFGWMLMAFTGLLLATYVYFQFFDTRQTTKLIDEYGMAPWSLLLALGLTAAAWLIWRGRTIRRGVFALSGFFISMWLVFGWYGYPLLNPGRSTAPLMEKAQQLAGAETRLGIVDWKEQHLLFAAKPLVNFGFRVPVEAQLEQALAWLSEGTNKALMLPEDVTSPCLDTADGIAIGRAHRTDWTLFKAENILPNCQP